MSSILGAKIKENMNIPDEVIARNMLAASKIGANAYLNALLASTTPEVRAVYASSLNQMIGADSALTELAVKRVWKNPYIEPREQLSNVNSKADSVMEKRH